MPTLTIEDRTATGRPTGTIDLPDVPDRITLRDLIRLRAKAAAKNLPVGFQVAAFYVGSAALPSTAGLLAQLDDQVRKLLAGARAHALLLRGFDTHQELPSFAERYGLRAATVAIYPMYRGVARLCGMDLLPRPHGLDGQVAAMREAWSEYDYFFLHYKKTDEAGHDGDRPGKIAAIEALDAALPAIADLGPAVLIVTGDHASPSQLSAHSWHPVPVLMWGPHVGRDPVTRFGERACLQGALGQRPTMDLMPLALAAAGARVMLADVDGGGAEAVAEKIRARGGDARAARCDASRRAEIEAVVHEAHAAWGRLDVLCNVAGVPSDGPLDSVGEAEFDRVIAINLKSALFGCQAAVPRMAAGGGGSIVNVASAVIDAPAALKIAIADPKATGSAFCK